jgi:hypothetical protein
VDEIAFLNENSFQTAAQFGADLDVLRVRLDLARTCNQRGGWDRGSRSGLSYRVFVGTTEGDSERSGQ